MNSILLRADDLGYSEGVNYGIAKAVKDGIVRTVGLMPNMSAASHGVELLRGTSVCMGQHTNICIGKPLTPPERIPSLVRENGEFKSSRTYRTAKEDFVVLEEVLMEIEAQYDRFVALTGQQPHYLEGHAVMSPTLYQGLQIFAERRGLSYLGFSDHGEAVPFRNAKLKFLMESMEPDYDPFETLECAAKMDCVPGEYPMVIFHPGYLDAFIMKNSSLTIPRTKEVEAACSTQVRQWLLENDISIITYDDI